jgi:hypothetical protein
VVADAVGIEPVSVPNDTNTGKIQAITRRYEPSLQTLIATIVTLLQGVIENSLFTKIRDSAKSIVNSLAAKQD